MENNNKKRLRSPQSSPPSPPYKREATASADTTIPEAPPPPPPSPYKTEEEAAGTTIPEAPPPPPPPSPPSTWKDFPETKYVHTNENLDKQFFTDLHANEDNQIDVEHFLNIIYESLIHDRFEPFDAYLVASPGEETFWRVLHRLFLLRYFSAPEHPSLSRKQFQIALGIQQMRWHADPANSIPHAMAREIIQRKTVVYPPFKADVPPNEVTITEKEHAEQFAYYSRMKSGTERMESQADMYVIHSSSESMTFSYFRDFSPYNQTIIVKHYLEEFRGVSNNNFHHNKNTQGRKEQEQQLHGFFQNVLWKDTVWYIIKCRNYSKFGFTNHKFPYSRNLDKDGETLVQQQEETAARKYMAKGGGVYDYKLADSPFFYFVPIPETYNLSSLGCYYAPQLVFGGLKATTLTKHIIHYKQRPYHAHLPDSHRNVMEVHGRLHYIYENWLHDFSHQGKKYSSGVNLNYLEHKNCDQFKFKEWGKKGKEMEDEEEALDQNDAGRVYHAGEFPIFVGGGLRRKKTQNMRMRRRKSRKKCRSPKKKGGHNRSRSVRKFC